MSGENKGLRLELAGDFDLIHHVPFLSWSWSSKLAGVCHIGPFSVGQPQQGSLGPAP